MAWPVRQIKFLGLILHRAWEAGDLQVEVLQAACPHFSGALLAILAMLSRKLSGSQNRSSNLEEAFKLVFAIGFT